MIHRLRQDCHMLLTVCPAVARADDTVCRATPRRGSVYGLREFFQP